MKSRKGTAPPQSAPTIPPPAPAKPSGKAAQQVSAPQPPAPSKAPPAPKPQATTSKLPTAPATPVKASKASAAPAAPAASAPQALPQIKPVIPQPSAAALRSVSRSVLQDAEELAAQPVHLHRVSAKPAPAAKPVPVVEHAALGRLAPKAAPPAPAHTPASARQLAQEPSASPLRAETPPATKKPLGRPRKAAALAPADVADILQADLSDTRAAAPSVLAQQAIAEVRAAQAQRQPAPLPQTPAASPPQARPVVIEVGEPVRAFGAPSAALVTKEHAALCAYSAQVKMLRTDEEIGAAVRALGADDLVVLRQVDRLRRLGGHSRTLCATDDAAVDRLTRAGLVVVLPWNGPKPPEPACYAELTPAGAAVVALLPQPPRSAAQESEETVKTLQRYTEPRKTGRPPGKG